MPIWSRQGRVFHRGTNRCLLLRHKVCYLFLDRTSKLQTSAMRTPCSNNFGKARPLRWSRGSNIGPDNMPQWSSHPSTFLHHTLSLGFPSFRSLLYSFRLTRKILVGLYLFGSPSPYSKWKIWVCSRGCYRCQIQGPQLGPRAWIRYP